MNQFQKSVKYIAIVVAIVLAISIISLVSKLAIGVATLIMGMENDFNFSWMLESSDNDKVTNEEFSDIIDIDITADTGYVTIKEGDSFRVQARNVTDEFVCESVNGRLKIDSNEDDFFQINYTQELAPNIEITLPVGFKAENFDIEIGAGEFIADVISSDKVTINSGVGHIKIDRLDALKADIKGGVGLVYIESGNINDMDLEAGVGNVEIRGNITGRNDVQCGIGQIKLYVLAEKSDYNIEAEKGIGNISIDGRDYIEKVDNNLAAENDIFIEGGMGNFTLDFE